MQFFKVSGNRIKKIGPGVFFSWRYPKRTLISMGVATTTDTTDSVRTSFEVFKNLYGMSVQVDETAKSKKEGKAAVWETFVKATPE